jgi:hypothetical protein
MANQVTLTFAGKTQDLEQGMQKVGAGAEQMSLRITNATNQSSERFDHLSQQSSLLSGGIGDVGGALTEAFGENTAIGQFGAQMESASAVVMGFTGVMDLGVFATNNFKIASAASAVQTGIMSGVTKVAAAAQWLMNTALLASPITWIVVGIIAVIAVIVLIAKKTDWFSKLWTVAWTWIKKSAASTWEYLKKIPGWIGQAFSKVAGFITAPYRFAFNMIAKAWNNTIGRLSWTVPGWVPIFGGNTISVPNLPTFHSGGVVGGVRGTAVPIMAQAGERVTSIGGGGDGDGGWVRIDMGELGDALLPAISRAVERKGGRVTALGVRIVGGTVR